MIAIPAKISVSNVQLPADVAARYVDVPVEVGAAIQFIEGQPYTGPYTVTPSTNQQTLQTEDKAMTGNVVVNAIPYTETDNAAGGKTLSIG